MCCSVPRTNSTAEHRPDVLVRPSVQRLSQHLCYQTQYYSVAEHKNLNLQFPQTVNIHAQAYISAVDCGRINTERICTKLMSAIQ